MKRQQQQVTDFFQRKAKCIGNRDNSASDVNISDNECKYFCSEDKGAVLINDCKPDSASTSSNNSKSDAVSIHDRLLKIRVLSKVDPTFIVSGFSNYHENSESHKGFKEALLVFNQNPVSATLSAQVSKELEKVQKALITIVSSIKFLATSGLAFRGKQEKEDFIGLYETSSTTGDTLAAIIEDILLSLDLSIKDC
ncbi:hypothetical protein PR048_008014 [Dryococelus australis]|uniref:Uncharacterized protein n=1 Tax=Dryococelus australis TaxID=614101 RepID=A0ABQ9HVW1_9NEOP|nr:hypothetical protein PR048_008014 [Dryococelus australis]